MARHVMTTLTVAGATADRYSIARIVRNYFDSFTILAPNVGYWNGQQEESFNVQIVHEGSFAPGNGLRERAEHCARALAVAFRQECVMLTEQALTEFKMIAPAVPGIRQ